MKPIERVKIIIHHYGLSISAFEKKTGLSNNSIQTAIKRNSNLKDETLNTILKKFPQIDPTWLLTGQGSMIQNMVSEPNPQYPTVLDEEKIQYIIEHFELCKKHPILGKLIELEREMAIKESFSQILIKKGLYPDPEDYSL